MCKDPYINPPQCPGPANKHIMDLSAASTEGQVENEYGTCAISYGLDVEHIIKSVQDDCAGATVNFIGDYFAELAIIPSQRYL